MSSSWMSPRSASARGCATAISSEMIRPVWAAILRSRSAVEARSNAIRARSALMWCSRAAAAGVDEPADALRTHVERDVTQGEPGRGQRRAHRLLAELRRADAGQLAQLKVK